MKPWGKPIWELKSSLSLQHFWERKVLWNTYLAYSFPTFSSSLSSYIYKEASPVNTMQPFLFWYHFQWKIQSRKKKWDSGTLYNWRFGSDISSLWGCRYVKLWGGLAVSSPLHILDASSTPLPCPNCDNQKYLHITKWGMWGEELLAKLHPPPWELLLQLSTSKVGASLGRYTKSCHLRPGLSFSSGFFSLAPVTVYNFFKHSLISSWPSNSWSSRYLNLR